MDQSLLKLYLQGMVSLYGAIPEDQALEIIRSLDKEPVTPLELTLLDLNGTFIVRYDDVLAHEAIWSEEELDDLLEWQDDKPYYVPDRELLRKYGDGLFFERPPAYAALKAFLAGEMGLDAAQAEEICDDLHGYSSMSDLEPGDIPYEFARRKIDLRDPDLADRLMERVHDLERSTRQWANRGFTFEELPDPEFEFPDEEWTYDPDDLLLDTIVALVNLYGVVPKQLAADAFNRVSGEPVTVADIDELDLSFDSIMALDEDLVAAELAEDDERLEDLLQAQEGKPYYLPEPEQLILYADESYFEDSPQYDQLCAFIQKHWFHDELAADSIAAEISLIIRESGFDMEPVLDWLEENDVQVESDRMLRAFTALVQDLANHSRLWALRGHTPAEMQSQRTPADQPKADAGRNDPCPCGSGRKFKNCCGQ